MMFPAIDPEGVQRNHGAKLHGIRALEIAGFDATKARVSVSNASMGLRELSREHAGSQKASPFHNPH